MPTATTQLDAVLSPQAKEALGHLELFARRKVQGYMHGVHPSKRLGVSTEFDHHKLYQPGDPLKAIDWKASARHDRVYVKRSVEDSALSIRLVIDRSGSMAFAGNLGAGSAPSPVSPGEAPTLDSKYLQAARLTACLAYLITGHGDSVGLTMASGKQTFWLPAGSTQRHLVALLTALVTSEPAGADALESSLRALADRAERRGIVVVISDLMFDPLPIRKHMQRLAAQGHELILFQPLDPVEQDFPFNRWVQFGDLENPAVRHRVDGVLLKKLYRQEHQRLLDDWAAWSKRHDIHRVAFRTDEHVDAVLSHYVLLRSGHGGR